MASSKNRDITQLHQSLVRHKVRQRVNLPRRKSHLQFLYMVPPSQKTKSTHIYNVSHLSTPGASIGSGCLGSSILRPQSLQKGSLLTPIASRRTGKLTGHFRWLSSPNQSINCISQIINLFNDLYHKDRYYNHITQ